MCSGMAFCYSTCIVPVLEHPVRIGHTAFLVELYCEGEKKTGCCCLGLFFYLFFQDFVGIYLYTIATYQVLVIFTSTICSCKGCCAYFGVPSVFSIRYTGDSYSIYTIYITVSITVVTGLSVPRCPYINRAFTISTLL